MNKKNENNAYSSLLHKYGYEKYEVFIESIKTIYNVEKEEVP